MASIINETYSNLSGKLTNVSDTILADIQKIAADKDWKIYVSSGHRPNDHDSRHKLGVAVDIAAINGNSYNRNREEFTKLGDELVDSLESMGYVFGEFHRRNGEKIAHPKGYLWKTMSGGNHFDHIHVSNATGAKSTIMRATATTVIEKDSKKITDWNQVKTWITNNFSSSNYGSYLLINIDGKVVRIYSNGTAEINVKTKETWELVKLADNSYSFKIGSTEYSPSANDLSSDIATATSSSAPSDFKAIAQKASEVDDSWKVIDYVQLVMDFLGFIPIIGDAIDLINALIYIVRAEMEDRPWFYLDAVLSLIGAIPGAGSFAVIFGRGLKQSITVAAKGRNIDIIIKQAFIGNTKEWNKFIKESIDNGSITIDQLKDLSKYGKQASDLLKNTKRTLKKYESAAEFAGIPVNQVSKQFDEWIRFVDDALVNTGKVTSKTAGDIAQDIAVGVRKVVWKGTKAIIKLPFKITFWATNIITGGTLRMLTDWGRSAFGFTTKRREQLVGALRLAYRDKLIASPQVAAQMMKANKQVAGNLDKIFKSYFPNQRLGGIWNESTDSLYRMLKDLQKTNPKEYKKVAQQIANQSATSTNIHYRQFVGNELQQAYQFFRPGRVIKGVVADEGVLGIFKNMKFGLKSWDVIGNEARDFFEQIGYDEKDDPNGVFVPLAFAAVMHYSGDAELEEQGKTELDPKDSLSRDELKELSELYKNAEGETPTEKITSMSSQGVDSLKLWAFGKVLGL